jgi:hypothetical protein
MCETKKSKPLQINENYPSSQQYFHTQPKYIFQSLRDSKEIKNISFLILKFFES